MKKFKSAVTLLLCLAMLLPLATLTGCDRIRATDLMAGIRAEKVSGKEPDAAFVRAGTAFALSLFQETLRQEEGGNILISPLSLWLALSMTANGAAGKTRAQMERLLGGDIPLETLNEYLYSYVKDLPSGSKYKLSRANSIWMREGRIDVKKDFLQTAANYYGAAAYAAPFDASTVRDVNGWVKKHTDGMIDGILQDIDPQTVMLLINALAFDAAWEEPYTKTDVRDETFTAVTGEKKRVPMMHSREQVYLEDDNATGFIRYYKDKKYGFAALLPNEGVDIYEYIASLTPEDLQKTLDKASSLSVQVAMPKFESDYRIKMNDVLKSLGMVDAFGAGADFSRLGTSADGVLYVGEVLHKTYISVDEDGTKAGAASVVAMEDEGVFVVDGRYVRLDRPFVYMILDLETNLPVFIGVVTVL